VDNSLRVLRCPSGDYRCKVVVTIEDGIIFSSPSGKDSCRMLGSGALKLEVDAFKERPLIKRHLNVVITQPIVSLFWTIQCRMQQHVCTKIFQALAG